MHTSRPSVYLLEFSILVFCLELDIDIYNSLDSSRNDDDSDLKPNLSRRRGS